VKSWQILKRAIPDGKCDEVGKKLGVGGDTVRRWRREPESDDAPLSTGRANPLDRVEDLIDVVLLVNPTGAHAVAEHPRSHYLSRADTLVLSGSVKNAAAVALDDMVQAVNAISLDAPLEEVETKIEQADARLAELKRHMRANYPNRNGHTVYSRGAHLSNAGE
jgi:hypothetical protein